MSRIPKGDQPLTRVLSRRWLLLALVPVIVGATAYASEASNPARFASQSSVLIQTTDLGAVLAGVPDLTGTDPYRTLATEVVVASTPQVKARALEALKVPGDTPLARDAAVDIKNPGSVSGSNPDVIDINVTTGSADFSQTFATAMAQAYIAFRTEVANGEITKARDQVRARMAEIQGRPGAQSEYNALVDRAEKLETLLLLGNNRARLLTSGSDPVQVAPKPLRRGIVGLLLGLLIGGATALLLERIDKSVRDEDEISQHVGAPILAHLPDPRRLGRRGTAIALHEPGSAETEAFRLLRANLRFGLLGREGHSVGITSGLEAEGKTFVATNLAIVAAAAGARVVLVDLDLRRPTVHRVLGIDRGPGVSDVLTGSADLRDALTPIDIPENLALSNGTRGSLEVLPAGSETPNPGEVCASVALRGLLKDLESRFELVVVDTPPTGVVTDALPIAASLSGVIAVVRRPNTRRPVLDALRTSLEGVGGAMGIVLTAAWKAPSSFYNYSAGAAEEASGSGAVGATTGGPPA